MNVRHVATAASLALVPTLAYGWLAAASALYCLGMDRWDAYTFPFNQWLTAAPYWRLDWWMTLVMAVSAAWPTLLLLVCAFGVTRHWWRTRRRRLTPTASGDPKPTEPGVTDNHGHSQWRSMEAAKALFPGPHPLHGGVVVGEAYRVDQDLSVTGMRFAPRDRRTWGKGGLMPLLIDPCTEGSGHSILFAGTGSYKTTSAVTTAIQWWGSSVVLDPSAEVGPMLDEALREQAKKVVHLGVGQDSMNVLGWIDINHPEAEIHVRTVVSWIYEEERTAGSRQEDPFFAPMGRELITCLLAHLLWSDIEPEARTLATLAAGISVPEDEMITLLTGIRASSNSLMARRIAGVLMKCKAEETFSGVFLNAVRGISWLFTDAYADLVSVSTFDPQTLLDGQTTVFLNINLRTLETTPAIARVLVGALLNTVYMDDGKSGRRVLFLLDEAARLGRLKALETARDTGRKYGVVLHMLWQSVGQMAEIWGREGTKAWIDAAAWVGYAAIRAGGAGKDLSEQLGAHGVMAYSEGDNKGQQKPWGLAFGSRSKGTTTNSHEIRRSLIQAAEMQQDLREDEIIIVPSTGLPIRCGRAIYFRRPEMAALVATNRFDSAAPPTSSVTKPSAIQRAITWLRNNAVRSTGAIARG